MKKPLLILLFVPLSFFTNLYSQGLNFSSKEDIESLSEFEPNNFGFTELLPFKYSLEKYVPTVLSQGSASTCVGYALGYYALSTMHNIKFNRTYWAEKVVNSFDPLYAYAMAGSWQKETNCSSGLQMLEAMKTFSEFGNKKMFFGPNKDCEDSISGDEYEDAADYISPYILESFSFIQSYNRNYIENVKKSIYNGQPVITGIGLTDSFDLLMGSSSDSSVSDLWSPDESEEKTGGHAVCVIGYDDNKYGGSFRVVNSWGKDYGDKGYFWIKYDDLQKYSRESYNISPAYIDNLNYDKPGNFKENYIYYVNEEKNYIYEGLLYNGKANGYGIESWIGDNDSWIYSVGLYENDLREGVHLTIGDNGELKKYEFQDGKVIRSLGFSSNNSEGVDLDYIESIIPDVSLKPTLQSDINSFNAEVVGVWKIRKNRMNVKD